MSVPFVNAIAWAQFRLLGGWKNTLITGIAYAAIMGATMFGVARALTMSPSATLSYFVGLFLGLQVLALVMYGTFRVSAAVRSDVSSRVIESHRLMPLGSGSAIVGYLLGAPIQALCLFGINVVLGAIAASGGWVAACVLGLAYQREFQRFLYFRLEGDRQPAFVTSYISVLLLAALPIASAARLADAPPPGRRPSRYVAWVVVLAATAICMGMVIVAPPVPWTAVAIVRTAIAVAAFLLAIRHLLGIAYRARWWSRRMVFGWLLLTWFVPNLIEMLRMAPAMDSPDQHLSQIACCSPPAEIFQVWSRNPEIHATSFSGLTIQCAAAVLLAGIYYATRRRVMSVPAPVPAGA